MMESTAGVNLRPYQEEGLEKIRKAYRGGERFGLNCIPMGGGKTIMQGALIAGMLNKDQNASQNLQAIIIEYRSLLVAQTAKSLKENFGIDAAIEQAEKQADPEARVVLASAKSLAQKERLKKYDPSRRRLIIIDEAHHAVDAQTKKILDHCGALKGTAKANSFSGLLTGWTGTSSRMDGQGLDQIFDSIMCEIRLEDLVAQGYLVTPLGYLVPSKIDLDALSVVKRKAAGMDFDDDELARLIDTDSENQLIVDSYFRLSEGLPTIVYCANIEHAGRVAERFRKQNVKAEAISCYSPRKVRREALAGISNGKLDVLVNVDILGEGVDFPVLTCAILARSTCSEVVFRQQCGRVLRLCKERNKTHAIIIDIKRNSSRHKLCGLNTIFGIPQSILSAERPVDLVEAAEVTKKIKDRHPLVDLSGMNTIESLKRISHIERVDLLTPPPALELISATQMPWFMSDERAFTLPLSPNKHVVMNKNCLNQYEIQFSSVGDANLRLGKGKDLTEVTRIIKRFLEDSHPDSLKVVSTSATWNQETVSIPQLKFLASKNVTFDANGNKGDASILIKGIILRDQQSAFRKAEIILEELDTMDLSPLPVRAIRFFDDLRKQVEQGQVEKKLVDSTRKMLNALKAATLLKQIQEIADDVRHRRSSRFCGSIAQTIRDVLYSGGRYGFVSEGAIDTLSKILTEVRSEGSNESNIQFSERL